MLQVVTFNIGGARGMRPAPHDHEKLAGDALCTLKQVINPAQPTVIALQGKRLGDGRRQPEECRPQDGTTSGREFC